MNIDTSVFSFDYSSVRSYPVYEEYQSVINTGVMESGFIDGIKKILKAIYNAFHKAYIIFINFIKSIKRKLRIASVSITITKLSETRFTEGFGVTAVEFSLIKSILDQNLLGAPTIEDLKKDENTKYKDIYISIGEYLDALRSLDKLSGNLDKELLNLISECDKRNKFGEEYSTVDNLNIDSYKKDAEYLSIAMDRIIQIFNQYVKDEKSRDKTRIYTKGMDFEFSKVPKSVSDAIKTKDPKIIRNAIIDYCYQEYTFFIGARPTRTIEVSYLIQITDTVENMGIKIWEPNIEITKVPVNRDSWNLALLKKVLLDMKKNFSKERASIIIQMKSYLDMHTKNRDSTNNSNMINLNKDDDND